MSCLGWTGGSKHPADHENQENQMVKSKNSLSGWKANVAVLFVNTLGQKYLSTIHQGWQGAVRHFRLTQAWTSHWLVQRFFWNLSYPHVIGTTSSSHLHILCLSVTTPSPWRRHPCAIALHHLCFMQHCQGLPRCPKLNGLKLWIPPPSVRACRQARTKLPPCFWRKCRLKSASMTTLFEDDCQ